MATTELSICNLALSRIGVKAPLTVIDDSTPEGVACGIAYPVALDDALAHCDWSWAKKRAVLVEDTVNTRSGWDHVYTLPTDLLKPISLYPGTRTPTADQRIPFAIEGILLLTDAEPTTVAVDGIDGPELLYLYTPVPEASFSPRFANALAWAVAAELALSIAQKPALEQAMRQRYVMAISAAVADDLTRGREDQPPPGRYLNARG